MALFILCDPKYRHGVWCDAKLRGIMDEAARRRIQPEVFTDITDVKNAIENSSGEASVILLFDSMDWLKNTVDELCDSRTHIILSANYIDILLPVVYSLVGTDVDGAMREMIDYLHSCGKKRIAMVGVNPDSSNDTGRATMFKRYLSDDKCRVFYSGENMLECFDEFLKVQEEYDAAVCTNDLIAICLIEHLKTVPRGVEKLFVLSHTDTVMARLYGDGITSITTNFYNCGRLLVETYFNRIKYGLVASKNLLPTTLKVRGSTDNIPYYMSNEIPKPIVKEELPFSTKTTLPTGDIGRLERMLAASDLVNLKLIYCLLCGYNYDKMSEFCFISSETARYRVRKIKAALQVQKKSDVAEIVRKYIKKESLLAIISELEEKNNPILV